MAGLRSEESEVTTVPVNPNVSHLTQSSLHIYCDISETVALQNLQKAD